MDDKRRIPESSGNSWIIWGFLYVALVVLPAMVAWWQVDGWLTGDFLLYLSQESSKLEGRGMMVREAIKPGPVLWQLAKKVEHAETDRFQRWVVHAEKHLPRAVRWIAWNETGELIPLRPDLSLPGTRRWQEVVKAFFRDPKQYLAQPEEYRSRVEREFQYLLGPKLRAEDVMAIRNEPIQGEFLGKTCLVFWFHSPPPTVASGAAGVTTHRMAGFFAVIFVEALPDNFWSRMAFQGYALSEFRDSDFPLGLLTFNRSPKQLFLPALPQSGVFKRKVLNELKRAQRSYIMVDDWLGMSVSSSPERNEQVLVFKNIHQELAIIHTFYRFLHFGVGLALVVGMGITILAQRGAGLNLPLKWRIGGYFLLAVGLPMFGLVQGTFLLGHQRAERLKENCRRRLQEAARVLDKGQVDSLPSHALEMARRIDQVAHVSVSVEHFSHRLRGLMDEKRISNYFLADSTGRLLFQGDETVDRWLVSILKTALQIEMVGGSGGREAEPDISVGKLMMEEVGKVCQVAEPGEGNALSRPGRWNRFRLSHNDVWVMKCLVRLSGKPYGLILAAKETNLEFPFLRMETVTQRFASSNPIESVELAGFSQVPSEWPHFPPGSPVCLQPQLRSLLGGEGEVFAEIPLDGETYLIYSPTRKNLVYRPVFYSSLTRAYVTIEAQGRQLAFTAVAALAVALLLGVLLANRLLIPIRRIDGALALVHGGDLQVTLPVESGDEIGHISRTFNQMVEGLREKKRMQAYVSEAVMAAVRDPEETHVQLGKVIEATILFSDIRGFTTLCEAHFPDEIFAMLNAFLGGVESVLARYDGEVDKFIGDAVMAVFRNPGPDQALKAVLAALAMREFLKDFNRARQEKGLFPINIGVGINTGKVMQGDVGSERRKDLTVIGDEVNLAARLETASKEGVHTQIVIAESTWNCIRDHVEAVEMARTTVKGKQQSIRMFEVVGLRISGVLSKT